MRIVRAAVIALAAMVAGCAGTRSISNPGYPANAPNFHDPYPDMAYRGEIDHFGLLVPVASEAISDAGVAEAPRARDARSAG